MDKRNEEQKPDPLERLEVPGNDAADEIDDAAILNELLRDISPELLAEPKKAAKPREVQPPAPEETAPPPSVGEGGRADDGEGFLEPESEEPAVEDDKKDELDSFLGALDEVGEPALSEEPVSLDEPITPDETEPEVTEPTPPAPAPEEPSRKSDTVASALDGLFATSRAAEPETTPESEPAVDVTAEPPSPEVEEEPIFAESLVDDEPAPTPVPEGEEDDFFAGLMDDAEDDLDVGETTDPAVEEPVEPVTEARAPQGGGLLDEDSLDSALGAALGLDGQDEALEEPDEDAAVPELKPEPEPEGVEPVAAAVGVAALSTGLDVEVEKPMPTASTEPPSQEEVAALMKKLIARRFAAILTASLQASTVEKEEPEESLAAVAEAPGLETEIPEEFTVAETPAVEADIPEEFTVVGPEEREPTPEPEVTEEAIETVVAPPPDTMEPEDEIATAIAPDAEPHQEPQAEEEFDVAKLLVEDAGEPDVATPPEEEEIQVIVPLDDVAAEPAPEPVFEEPAPPVEAPPAPPVVKVEEDEEELDPLVAEMRAQAKRRRVIGYGIAAAIAIGLIWLGVDTYVKRKKYTRMAAEAQAAQAAQERAMAEATGEQPPIEGQPPQTAEGKMPDGQETHMTGAGAVTPSEAPKPEESSVPQTTSTTPAPVERTPVRSPAPGTTATQTAPPAGLVSGTGNYTVQVQAFGTESRAQQARSGWERKGYTVVTWQWVNPSDGKSWYRLGLGRYPNSAEANRSQAYLKSAHPEIGDWAPVRRIPEGAW